MKKYLVTLTANEREQLAELIAAGTGARVEPPVPGDTGGRALRPTWTHAIGRAFPPGVFTLSISHIVRGWYSGLD